MWNYAGGWQELFPSVNDAVHLPRPADPVPRGGRLAAVGARGARTATATRHGCGSRTRARRIAVPARARAPARRGQRRRSFVEETVRNESAEDAHFVWGHHCVVGPPFLEPGCRLEIPARTIVTSTELWEPETARLEPGRREPWPLAPLRAGGTVDLRDVPGPETGSHDDLYVTELEAGWLEVSNPRLELTFRLEWDHDAVRLDRPLAALRRRGRAAARRVVRARHRAVDEHARPRARRRGGDGRRARRRGVTDDAPAGPAAPRLLSRARVRSQRTRERCPSAGDRRSARARCRAPSERRSPGAACVRGSSRATSAPPSSTSPSLACSASTPSARK